MTPLWPLSAEETEVNSDNVEVWIFCSKVPFTFLKISALSSLFPAQITLYLGVFGFFSLRGNTRNSRIQSEELSLILLPVAWVFYLQDRLLYNQFSCDSDGNGTRNVNSNIFTTSDGTHLLLSNSNRVTSVDFACEYRSVSDKHHKEVLGWYLLFYQTDTYLHECVVKIISGLVSHIHRLHKGSRSVWKEK